MSCLEPVEPPVTPDVIIPPSRGIPRDSDVAPLAIQHAWPMAPKAKMHDSMVVKWAYAKFPQCSGGICVVVCALVSHGFSFRPHTLPSTMNRAGAAAPYLGQWVRALSTTPMSFAVPATSTIGPGLLGMFSKKQAMPPLTVPLDGVEPVTPAPVSAEIPPTETASLANGLRLGTQDILVRATARWLVSAIKPRVSPRSHRPPKSVCRAPSQECL
jgi:hypothetical protein